MNKDIISEKWKEIKGEIQKTWGQMTGDEIERTNGDKNEIAELLRRKYGISKDEASAKVAKIYDKFKEAKDDVTRSVKDRLT